MTFDALPFPDTFSPYDWKIEGVTVGRVISWIPGDGKEGTVKEVSWTVTERVEGHPEISDVRVSVDWLNGDGVTTRLALSEFAPCQTPMPGNFKSREEADEWLSGQQARRGRSWVDRGLDDLLGSVEPERPAVSTKVAATPCGACGCPHCTVANYGGVMGCMPGVGCRCAERQCPCTERSTA